ncbi:MAG: hypothetical protein DMF84_16105 [Acidobacteria bacterium]|nr:MAG: hypothetical protein DMF84_16105 [Acidobacteriota bacterium]
MSEVLLLRASVPCVLLLMPAAAAAQSVDGTVDWGYGRSTYETGDQQTTNASFTQAYTLGYRSILWDPRFLTYAGELTFNRNALTFGPDASSSQQTGFKGTANLFATRPFRGSISGSRGFGGESANYPESSTVRGGLTLPAGSAPELKTAKSEFGMNWQLASKSLPRVELSYQDSSAKVAAGSLSALQRQSSMQALVARESPRLSNTLRYQRNGFDTGLSQAFRQQYRELGYELVAKATDRTWGTARAGRRTTFSRFDVPDQFTDIGVDGYRPPPGGEVTLDYGMATLAHQAAAGLSADMSVGFDRERSAAGGTSALLATAGTRYHPFGGLVLHGSGTYGERGQEFADTRVLVLTRGARGGAEYSLTSRFIRATAGYDAGRGWNRSDRGVEGESRTWHGRLDASTEILHFVQLSVGHERGRSRDELLTFGNQWQERTHASARSTLTRRITVDASYEVASIDRGIAPLLFQTRYTQATASTAFELARERRLALTAGRFQNRASAADDANEYVGLVFDGALIGPLHISVTARREHTTSTVVRLDQDGYYTSGVIDYRVRLFTFSLEHRYTNLSLSTAGRIDPLTFTGNQILFRVGRRFGFTP